MSAKEHKQQRISQIFLPLILSFSLVAAAATFIFSGIAGQTLDHRVWGDISAILIILPVLVLLVFKLIFLIFLIFLGSKTYTILSVKLSQVNSFVCKTARMITQTTRAAVKPVILGESTLAAFTRKSKGKEEQENNG